LTTTGAVSAPVELTDDKRAVATAWDRISLCDS